MTLNSDGTATANVPVGPIRSATQMEDLGGPGSAGHRAARKLFAGYQDAWVTYLPVAETTAGMPDAADLDLTFAGTVTAQGVDSVWVDGERCDAGYLSGATATERAAAMKGVINAKTWLPSTADNVAGVLTITCKTNGLDHGDGTTAVHRVHAETTAGTGATLVTENGGTTDGLGLGTAQAGVEGSTTAAAQLATALAVIANVRHYYLLNEQWTATSISNLKTHIVNKSEPKAGYRSVGIIGYTGTVANAATLTIAANYERLSMGWVPKAENDIAEIVGVLGAARAKGENTHPVWAGSDFYPVDLRPQWDPADRPTGQNLNDAINDGITPMAANEAGNVQIVFSATTRSKDSAGTNADRRVLETHRVSVADDFADILLRKDALENRGKILVSDKLLSDGSVDTTQKLNAGVITPSTAKPMAVELLRSKENVTLQDVDQSVAKCRVQRDPTNTGRLEWKIDIRAVDICHQSTFDISEVSPG